MQDDFTAQFQCGCTVTFFGLRHCRNRMNACYQHSGIGDGDMRDRIFREAMRRLRTEKLKRRSEVVDESRV